MKNLLGWIFIFCFLNTNGQKTEIRFCLDSGLSSYGGNGASSYATMAINPETDQGQTINPYGKKTAFSYGASLDLKHIFKNNTFIGTNLGYEMLRSKTSVTYLNGDFIFYTGLNYTNISFLGTNDGETILTNYNINSYSYFGYRFNAKNPIDVQFGFDLAYILGSKEVGEASAITSFQPPNYGELNFSSSNNRYYRNFDFRPRLQIATDYKKFGIYIAYSYGIINLKKEIDIPDYNPNRGGNAYSRVFRFGLTYKLI